MANLCSPIAEFSYQNGALYVTGFGYDNSDCAFIGQRAGYFGTGYIEETDLPTSIGADGTITAWVQSSGASHGTLRCYVDAGDGMYVLQASRSDDVGAWTEWDIGSVTPLGFNGRIKFDTTASANNHGWYVDAVVWNDPMAVKLAERPIDAVVSLLQSNLAGELTAIDTDRGDGVTMVAPSNGDYFKRPRSVLSGKGPWVEVFESSYDFLNPYADADAQRANYKIPLAIRVTYAKSAADTADIMAKRMRRYATGVFNCINKNPDLGDSDDATLIAVVTSVDAHWVDQGEDTSIAEKAQTTLGVEVHCNEVQ